jgi:trigger factor
MKVTQERGVGLERTLTIEVPAADVLKRINSVATDIARKVNIPGGYRKLQHKVARVKQVYRGDIASQVASDLVEEQLRTVIQDEKIKIVGMPRVIDMGEIRQGQPFIYKVGLEVQPTIEKPKYDGFLVPIKPVDVSDEEVGARLEDLRKKHTQRRTFEGDALAEGHRLTLAIEPECDDAELKGRLSVPQRNITLTKGDTAEPLYDALVGSAFDQPFVFAATAGDMPVYGPADQDDVTYTWTVTVSKVEEEIVPELDDDFANEARGLKSLLALRGELREEIGKEKEKDAESTVRAALTQQLLTNNKIDLPFRAIMDMFSERMKAYEEQVAPYRATLGDEMVNNLLAQQRNEQIGSATNETALYFLMEAVAKDMALEIGDDDVTARITEMATAQGVQESYLRAQLGQEKLENLKFEIRADRIYAAIRQRGRELPLEEFVAIMERKRKGRALRNTLKRHNVRRHARAFRSRRAS